MRRADKRRAFGQHFLKDHRVIEKICKKVTELCAANGTRHLLEIGPGMGALTLPMLEGLDRMPVSDRPTLVLAERDRELIDRWKQFPTPLEILEGDFAKAKPSVFLKPGLGVFSNLPYSAGTAIATLLLAQHSPTTTGIQFMVLMFQKEVAQRFLSPPGTRACGSLGIWTQNLWDIESLISVPPGAFRPPPKVDSEVLVFRPRATPRVTADSDGFERLLKGLFSQRRQMIRKTLKAVTPSAAQAQKALDDSHLDGTERAEALLWDHWKSLFESLSHSHSRS